MRITLKDNGKTPIYQQIADAIVAQIDVGRLPAGSQLPTVRALADENHLALGTVKHAYDTLEQQGYVQKAQGRGTFVRGPSPTGHSAKDQAMDLIDGTLEQLAALGFAPEEIRIFLDLKLRQWAEQAPQVDVAAVDCCPEALYSMSRQIAGYPHVEMYEYLLPAVLQAAHPLAPGVDLVVTTPTHYDEVAGKIDDGTPVLRLVMAISRTTLLELERIPAGDQVGILCQSQRFANIIARSCARYGVLAKAPLVALYHDGKAAAAMLRRCERLILPPNHLQLVPQELAALLAKAPLAAPPLTFSYQIEQGSLLALEEQLGRLYAAKQR